MLRGAICDWSPSQRSSTVSRPPVVPRCTIIIVGRARRSAKGKSNKCNPGSNEDRGDELHKRRECHKGTQPSRMNLRGSLKPDGTHFFPKRSALNHRFCFDTSGTEMIPSLAKPHHSAGIRRVITEQLRCNECLVFTFADYFKGDDSTARTLRFRSHSFLCAAPGR